MRRPLSILGAMARWRESCSRSISKVRRSAANGCRQVEVTFAVGRVRSYDDQDNRPLVEPVLSDPSHDGKEQSHSHLASLNRPRCGCGDPHVAVTIVVTINAQRYARTTLALRGIDRVGSTMRVLPAPRLAFAQTGHRTPPADGASAFMPRHSQADYLVGCIAKGGGPVASRRPTQFRNLPQPKTHKLRRQVSRRQESVASAR